MIDPRFLHPDTLALHAGQVPDPVDRARGRCRSIRPPPTFSTDADHAAGLFNLERAGHIYSRISNPTVAVLEERVAALEGGVAAVATASGQAAHASRDRDADGGRRPHRGGAHLYGGTINLLRLTLPRFGIETSFVDPRDPDAFAAAIRPETRLVLAEASAIPGSRCWTCRPWPRSPTPTACRSWSTPPSSRPHLCRPFDHGADLVVHSLTKWLGGHGVAIGGILVDGGRFDWQASGRFPTLTEPYPGYAGLAYADSFGPQAFAARARTEGLRDFGACLSPQNAFYLLLGIETLPLRMDRHVANTRGGAIPRLARRRSPGSCIPACRATPTTR